MLLLLSTITIDLFCQQEKVFALQNPASARIQIDTLITGNAELHLLSVMHPISDLALSGEVNLYSDSSLVRVILEDNNFNEYLIYETYPILAGSRQIFVEEAGEETFSLNNIIPLRLRIELIDASIRIKEIIVSEEGTFLKAAKSERLHVQTLNKIDRINRNILSLGQKWVAGETSISHLTYQEKKIMFGGRAPNFQGFEYYVGGVFVLPGIKSEEPNSRNTKSKGITSTESQYARQFSWKERHGED